MCNIKNCNHYFLVENKTLLGIIIVVSISDNKLHEVFEMRMSVCRLCRTTIVSPYMRRERTK